MAKNQTKSVSKTVYIVTFGIIALVLLGFYIHSWKVVKEEEKYMNSYLISTNTVSLEMNDISQMRTVLSETPSYYFVYIGFRKDKSVYNLEEKLQPLITEYSLQNCFYYLDVTDIKDKNKDYKQDIANELNISSDDITKVPIILYFKDYISV